jgi:hypothetical protein
VGAVCQRGQAETPLGLGLEKQVPVDLAGEVRFEFRSGGEEFGRELVCLAFDDLRAGLDVLVHDEVAEFVCGVEPAAGAVVLGPRTFPGEHERSVAGLGGECVDPRVDVGEERRTRMPWASRSRTT